MPEKIKLIFDCDNTMGMEGKDVDDGLTLIYLLGRPDIELLGVTLTYGNSTLDKVVEHTERLVADLAIDTPIFYGAHVVDFLVSTAASQKKEIAILATGSLTNLHEASLADTQFYANLRQCCIMGGIVEPLVINGHAVNELNFSINPKAAASVLNSVAPITLLNGHTTTHAFFRPQEVERLQKMEGNLYRYIEKAILPWIEKMKNTLGIDGFSNWDMAAAIYLSHPELFEDDYVFIAPSEEGLQTGNIGVSPEGKRICMPSKIKDIDAFNDIIFRSFERFALANN